MANNGPISVSAPNTSLKTATGTNLTFNTKYPFAKLDSTVNTSYQIITLFFNVETPTPPQPTGSPSNYTSITTLVYSYPHGYTYIPSTWFFLSLDNFATILGTEESFLKGGGTGFPSPGTKLSIRADATNIYFYVTKSRYYDGSIDLYYPIIGTFVSIRAYIFVEDLLGQSVPNQA